MPLTVANPPAEKPLMIYDGECAFCRKWIGRWHNVTEDRIDYAPSQEVASRFPEIPESDLKGAVQLILPNGEVFSGAAAAFKTLALSGRGAWLFKLHCRVRLFAILADALYAFIARRRKK
jgi:predicted DCC family thiol-disulfide oxidoreductase YuxK